ncbi:MAG: hypothetical protein MJB57_17955 [Gemmatimonadetes bacterium]|nr:hypothetical protein [Gemmatimonadota bacterium]
MRDLRPRAPTGALVLGATLLVSVAGPLSAQAPDSLRLIQSVTPLSGPPGTLVSVYTENLPLQARVHVGVGSTGAGFEALGEGTQTEFGEVTASVRIPDGATWDKPLVVIIFNGNFSPTGLSHPFHVTDGAGRVQRRGLITEEGGPCATMRDGDGYLYALREAPNDLRPGQMVTVEGRYAETSECGEVSTIEIARVARGEP